MDGILEPKKKKKRNYVKTKKMYKVWALDNDNVLILVH